MSKLQDKVDELVKYILEYKTIYWDELNVKLSKEESENIAAILIDRMLDNIEDADIESAYDQMYEPPDNPDQVYADAFQATWKN